MLYPPNFNFQRSRSAVRNLALAFLLFLFANASLNAAVVIDEDFSAGAGNFSNVSGGTWNVSGGRYVLSSPASGGAGLLGNISVHGTSVSGDFDLSTTVRITGTGSTWDDTAVVFCYQDTSNYYYVSLNESNDGNTKGVFKVVSGTPTELADIGSSISSDVDYPIEIQRSGSSIVVLLNSSQVASVSDSTFTAGKVGFGSKNDGAQYDDLLVDVPSGGSVLFSDDFDDGNANGWSVSTGNWSVNNQEYLVTNYGITSAGDSGWADYSVEAMVEPITADYSCLLGRFQDASNFYQIEVHAANDEVGLWKNVGGTWTQLDSYSTTINTNTWYELKLEMDGTSIKGYFNGSLVVSATDSSHSSGKVGVRANNDTRFDDIEASEITTSLMTLFSDDFDDGDASGWTTSGGTWSVDTQEYENTSYGLSHAGDSAWTDYSIQADVKPEMSTYSCIIGRFQDASNFYQLEVNEAGDELGMWKNVGGSWIQIGSYGTTVNANTWYLLKLEMTGSTIKGYLNDVERISVTDTTFSSGKIALRSGNDSRFDDVLVVGVGSGSGGGQVAAPQFSPGGGTYTSTQNVTITTSTSGATIRYTTDGSNPSPTTGTIHSGSIAISTTSTLKAIAYKNGMTDSSIASATYTINTGGGQVAAPSFSPGGGSYSTAQNVTISTSTSGATIRYTTNGSTPTATSGSVYSGAVSISSSSTLKAIAYKSGMTDSAVTSATYTIGGGSSGVSAPTHPNQTGLSALGITRANLPAATTYSYFAADSGSVITDKRFTTKVKLCGADNITFRRCWFQFGSPFTIVGKWSSWPNSENVTFEDCDFGQHGESSRVDTAHIYGFTGTITVKRCFFYNSADVISLWGGSTLNIEDSWVQTMAAGGSHTDCLQFGDNSTGEVYALRTTFENRTWQFNGNIAYAQEELTAGSLTSANIYKWGNAILMDKPCGTSGCSGPLSGSYYSFVDCIVTAGNSIMKGSNQYGEFIGNTVIRGTQNGGTDLGVQDSQYITIYDNVYHDNGATYTGGAVGGTANPVAIPNLGL